MFIFVGPKLDQKRRSKVPPSYSSTYTNNVSLKYTEEPTVVYLQPSTQSNKLNLQKNKMLKSKFNLKLNDSKVFPFYPLFDDSLGLPAINQFFEIIISLSAICVKYQLPRTKEYLQYCAKSKQTIVSVEITDNKKFSI